jgi:hypothetical protein
VDRQNPCHKYWKDCRKREHVVRGDCCCWVLRNSQRHLRVVVAVLSDSDLGAVNRSGGSNDDRVNHLVMAIYIFAQKNGTSRRLGSFRRISCVFVYLVTKC